jgi:putative tryptophan/tyrosine transport system substrate-binding protein
MQRRAGDRVTTRRELLIALGAGALAAPLTSFAQKPAKVFRIGFLGQGSALAFASNVDALRAGLRDLGYVEGRNIVIEFRWAEGKSDRLANLAVELVRLKVDVIVTQGTPETLAAKRATTTIPIVMATAGDPVATGLVASLARPDGNVTGSAIFSSELMVKRLELLKEAFPHTRRVAVLLNPVNPVQGLSVQAMESAARLLNVAIQRFEARIPNELENAFSEIAKQRVDAVVITQDGIFVTNAGAIADIAAKQRLPSIGFSEFAEVGGLIGYGVIFRDLYRRAAYFVDRILKGATPGDLPVEQATKFELVINRKTAKAIGVTIPQSLLQRADKVID